MPSPQNAMALPRWSGGNASSMMACDRGCRPPPVAPCITRKTMRKGRFGAMPQATDAMVKPRMEVISTRLRPKWLESHPVMGRMMAFDTR